MSSYRKLMIFAITVFSLFTGVLSGAQKPSKVEVKKNSAGTWRIYINGKEKRLEY